MGAVYRAHREDTGQVVAVKALLLPMEQKQERERFSAEIATMKLLRHDNIVRLYGFGQENGALYYAMEYVDGPSLSTLLKRGFQFTWEETVYIGASICRALKHAHDRGVVHRDIKPANILLVGEGVVKVSDYGIAQYFGSSRLTGVNQVVGTIEYMAPEQARAGALTPHTDMYSLGALMYVLLTGKPPFPARDLTQLLQMFRQQTPESIRSLRPEIPKVVDDVVFDLLQIQTEKRPGDARVIGRRLEAILRTSPNVEGDNPFKGVTFSLERRVVADSVENSRVDLENPSKTSQRPDFESFYPEENPDFPYRSVSDDDENERESPFERTTEAATGVEPERLEERRKRQAAQASDFSLSGETTLGASVESSRTTTSEQIGGEIKTKESPFNAETNASLDESEFSLAAERTPKRVATDPAQTQESNVSSSEKKPTSANRNAPTIVDDLSAKTSRERSTRRDAETPSTDELQVVPLERFKRSQFTPVDETELDSLPKEHDPNDSRYTWLRISVMLLLFGSMILLCANLIRTPSPDKLYERFNRKLLACKPSEFDAQLRRSEKDMEKFAETYPNDMRTKRTRYFLNKIKIEDLELRLERQIQNSSRGANQPIEREYLNVCREAAVNPERGVEKLRAFIVLFDGTNFDLDALEESFDRDDGNVDLFYPNPNFLDDAPSIKKKDDRNNFWSRWSFARPEETSELTDAQKLLYIAKRRLFYLRCNSKKERITDLALLNDRLQAAREFLPDDVARAEKLLNAALRLYGDQEWAKAPIDEFLAEISLAKESNGESDENANEEEPSEQ